MLFFANLLLVVFASHHDLATLLLLDLQTSQAFALEPNLVFHLIFLLNTEEVLSLFGVVLLLNHFRLFSFLLLLQHQGILHLAFLFVSLLGHHVVVLRHHALLLVVQLYIENFLHLLTLNLTYLLYFVLVPLFQGRDIASTLLSFLDLLPGLHFFLLKQSDSVSQQLRVSFDVLSPLLNVSQRLHLTVVGHLSSRSIHFRLLSRILGVILWCVRNWFHVVN